MRTPTPFLVAAGLLACASAAEAQVNTQQVIRRSLFSDQKAFAAGDAVTIAIVEDVQANNNASTTDSRSTDLGASVDINGSPAGGGIGTENTFRGQGATTRNERVRSKLSARVVEVDANGNLRIEGKRTTKINGETQTVTISGVVRVADIRSDNSVFSYNIMDLTLFFEGEGSVSTVQEPGLITKFLRMLF